MFEFPPLGWSSGGGCLMGVLMAAAVAAGILL